MKYILLLLLLFATKNVFSQKFISGAIMSNALQVKHQTEIEINDTLFILTDPKSGNVKKYKILSKSINNTSFKLSDNVRDFIADIQYYEKPPMKVKGTAYHYWITISLNNQSFTYFSEKTE